MPLLRMSADQAFQRAKSNAFNAWPSRQQVDNRVEPIAKPAINPSFSLVPQESVFTIGSCFARNVEAALERLGFEVPMRRLVVVEREEGDSESPEENVNIFNNYGVPSILNELEWALDPENPFDPDKCLLEVSRGGYCDLHLTRLMKPVTLAEASVRRERIKVGMSAVANCRVVIITLGLVEVWWDHVAQRYLNIAPPKQAAKKNADRFELHVLSHVEVTDYLRRVLNLLKRFGHADLKVLLTVSPVPLGLTFTDQDVMVANCYSKSVLRAAAQEIASENEHVDYYPSFESVTLSNRDVAWQDDLRHVTAEIVDVNVKRMISAYSNVGGEGDRALQEAQSREKARDVEQAVGLYREALEYDPDSTVARFGLARCLDTLGETREAIEALRPLLKGVHSRQATVALAKVYRHASMEFGFRRLSSRLETMGSAESVQELVKGYLLFEELDKVELFCQKLFQLTPRSVLPFQYLAQVAIKRGQFAEAEQLLGEGIAVNQNVPLVYGLLGSVQMSLSKFDFAKDSFERALSLNPKTKIAVDGMDQLRSMQRGRPEPLVLS